MKTLALILPLLTAVATAGGTGIHRQHFSAFFDMVIGNRE
jgi:hypothetical protein